LATNYDNSLFHNGYLNAKAPDTQGVRRRDLVPLDELEVGELSLEELPELLGSESIRTNRDAREFALLALGEDVHSRVVGVPVRFVEPHSVPADRRMRPMTGTQELDPALLHQNIESLLDYRSESDHSAIVPPMVV